MTFVDDLYDFVIEYEKLTLLYISNASILYHVGISNKKLKKGNIHQWGVNYYVFPKNRLYNVTCYNPTSLF